MVTKILFVHPNREADLLIPLGVAYLSACLKKEGFETSLFDTCFSNKKNLKAAFRERVKEYDIVGISCAEMNFKESLPFARTAREMNKVVVYGGTFVSVAPEEAIKEVGVDILCVGEAEQAFVEFVKKFSEGEDYFHTKNFWFKKGSGSILKNEVRELQDINKLPRPDWEMFFKESKHYEISFMSSRGCPYNCTYCCNHVYQKLYAKKGKYTRLMNPDKLIDEIKYAVKKFGLKRVYFSDDSFTLGKERILYFAERYKKEISLPIWIVTRANLVDFDILKALKEAGLESMAIGVESGNEYIREKVFRRHMSKETIIKAFDIANQLGINTRAFNIIGVDCETKDTIMETIELNRRLKPTTVQVTLLTPYRGTEIRERLKQSNLLLNYSEGDFHTELTIKNPNLSIAEIESWQKTAWIYIAAPRSFFPMIHLIRKLLQWSPNKVRRQLGEFALLGSMAFGMFKRNGLVYTSKSVVKRIINLGGNALHINVKEAT